MNKPIISVITPCFNAEKYIKTSIDSIIAQSFENFEIIIQDSLSNDNTIKLIESYQDHRIKIFSEKDLDTHDGLWKGLLKAKGNYIMFMPASDEYKDKDWFKKCVEILENDSLIGLVHGNDRKKYPNGDYGDLRFPEFENKQMPSDSNFLPYWISTKYHISELNYCVRKNIYLDCYKPYKFINYDHKYIVNQRIPAKVLESWNPLIMFTYNFVKKGYLPYHLPITATYTLRHNDSNGGSWSDEIKDAVMLTYLDLIDQLDQDIRSRKFIIKFKDGFGNVLKRKKLNNYKYKFDIFKHKFFRKNFDFFHNQSMNIHKIKAYLNFFLFPKRYIMKLSFFKYLRFIKHYLKFEKLNDRRFLLSKNVNQVEINDWGNNHSFDNHYVYHTAWASRKLYDEKPKEHIDISSDIRFASLISTFIKTEFYDIRKLKIELSGLNTNIADLMDLPFQSNSIMSISCMHVIEHCGLGRYGDIIDPSADLKAINELIRVLKPGGKLYFVSPIASKPRINFNAHRVYSYEQIIKYFSDLNLIEFALIPDDSKYGSLIRNPSQYILKQQHYACGCFLFTK